MKATTASAFLGALSLSATFVNAAPTVDESYPYTGPAVPIGDWVDPTINGNGKGFPRLVEAPAVTPASSTPSNNINVISLSYLPNGINIHYQTPFGLGTVPSVSWGTSATTLDQKASGSSHTYDRTPPCSEVSVTQCSQFFHEVQIASLESDTPYYYQIAAANGTTESQVLSFTTSRAAGNPTEFSIAVLNDMGYTNAQGTHDQLTKAIGEGLAFAWHGGDLSYADDWYSGILPCADDWPVCYNGSSSELPGGVTSEYETPLPAGEIPNQGGPLGGDMSVLYESNWDLWQQWMHNITSKVPYMVMAGNHEATCSEFDGPGNILTAYLNSNETNSTAPESALTYFSCPPSQRNFTAFQNRFRMPGNESGGVGNFWYSFDYGLAHFVAIDTETDFANSPEYPFVADLSGDETTPKENETYVTDSGPFGFIDGSYKENANYEQYQWLSKDLASVDRTVTPWVIVMSHRPMYSTQTASYQGHIRTAFQTLMLENGVDAYLSGHIHWYERLFPLTTSGKIDTASIANNNTYYTNPGVSMTHIINGMAGNIESHSTLDAGEAILNITAILDQSHYGFSKLTIHNCTALTWQFIRGDGGIIGDELTLLKHSNSSTCGTGAGTSSSASSSVATSTATSSLSSSTGLSSSTVISSGTSIETSSSVIGSSTIGSSVITGIESLTTEIVTAYTTYCPGATTFTEGSSTYTVTEATTLTITNCPCTLTHTISSTSVPESAAATSSPSSQGTTVVPGGPESSAAATPGSYESTTPGGPESSAAVSSAPGAAATSSVAVVPGNTAPTSSVAVIPGGPAASTSAGESAPPSAAASTSEAAPTAAASSSVPATPIQATGGANRIGPASFAGLAGLIGVAALLL